MECGRGAGGGGGGCASRLVRSRREPASTIHAPIGPKDDQSLRDAVPELHRECFLGGGAGSGPPDFLIPTLTPSMPSPGPPPATSLNSSSASGFGFAIAGPPPVASSRASDSVASSAGVFCLSIIWSRGPPSLLHAPNAHRWDQENRGSHTGHKTDMIDKQVSLNPGRRRRRKSPVRRWTGPWVAARSPRHLPGAANAPRIPVNAIDSNRRAAASNLAGHTARRRVPPPPIWRMGVVRRRRSRMSGKRT